MRQSQNARKISDYVTAGEISAAFSLLVNLLMSRVLKIISMVESLKSVE